MRRISRIGLIRLIRQMGKKRFLTIAVIAFLLLALPATIYLALTKQLIFKRAAFGEVTVNLVPTQVSKNVGEEFPVEVYLNSGDFQISATTIHIIWSYPTNQGRINLVKIEPEVGEGKPFTEAVNFPPAAQAGGPFTLIAKKSTNQLPKGTFKIATFTFKGVEVGGGEILPYLQNFQIIGSNEQNEDVSLTVKEGTKVAYTITGEENICRTGSCPAIASLERKLRPDSRFDIQVNWLPAPEPPPVGITYRVFRNIGAPVPPDHPAANLAGTTTETSFLDTNNSQGFVGGSEVHYDIDTYQACSESSKTQAIAPPPPGTSYFIGGLNCNPRIPPEGGALVRCSALYCENNPSIPCECKDTEYSPCDQLPDHVRNDSVFTCNSSTKQCWNSYSMECANASSFSFSCEEIDFGLPLNQHALWSVTNWATIPTPTLIPRPTRPQPTRPQTTPRPTRPQPTPNLTPLLPTSTPFPTPIGLPGVCHQDAVITLPGQVATLKFKIKFQGVDFGNLREQDKVQKVKLSIIKQLPDQLQAGKLMTILSKDFADVEVKPEKVGDDPIAVWSGQVSLTGVPAGEGYSLLIKGPKHLQRKFCEDKPSERAEEGYPYQCKGPGKIALTAGEMELDFSGVLLQGGDLPGPHGQDGVVNALDVSLIINILKTGQSHKEENLEIADIDLNGVVNFLDRSALIETLEEKYGDEE